MPRLYKIVIYQTKNGNKIEEENLNIIPIEWRINIVEFVIEIAHTPYKGEWITSHKATCLFKGPREDARRIGLLFLGMGYAVNVFNLIEDEIF